MRSLLKKLLRKNLLKVCKSRFHKRNRIKKQMYELASYNIGHFYYQEFSCYMNKRSKSENIIKLKKQLRQKQTKLQHLNVKIEQSQPILQTIYDKIKRKEEFVYQELNKSRRKEKVAREIAGKYSQLYREGLKIIEKNNFGLARNQYSTTNYLKVIDKGTGIQEIRNKGKSMYEKYLQKIDRTTKINPEFKEVPNKMKALQQQMNSGIQELKMIRKKSQNNLKRFKQKAQIRLDSSQSDLTSKASVIEKVKRIVNQQRQINLEEINKKYIQMNKMRLKDQH